MKKVCAYIVVMGILGLIWSFIIICIPAFLYSIKKNDADGYIEKKYGVICDKAELEGFLVYLVQSEEKNSMIVLNRNLWFPDRYKPEAKTDSNFLNGSNDYGYFSAININGQIQLQQSREAKKFGSTVFSIFLLAFSSTNLYWNCIRKKLPFSKSPDFP